MFDVNVMIVSVLLVRCLHLTASSLNEFFEHLDADHIRLMGGSSFEAVDSRPFVATTAPIAALTDSRGQPRVRDRHPLQNNIHERLPRIWAVRLLKGLR